MSKANLTIDLKSRKDKEGHIFYVGKLEAPALIDCRKGAVFLVFVSDQGGEQLQIAMMDKQENFDD